MQRILETILNAHGEVVHMFHNQTSGLDGSSAVHRKPVGLFQHLRETIQSSYYMYAFYQYTAYSSTSRYNESSTESYDYGTGGFGMNLVIPINYHE